MYSFSNKVMTLKAGSRLYIPNGFEQDGITPKFNVVVTTSDLNSSTSAGTTRVGFYASKHSTLWYQQTSLLCSGDTDTISGSAHIWYDTNTNIIKYWNGSAYENNEFSLPFCLVTMASDGIASIDQIFNGFGYIGLTAFVLPGVKVTLPDGLNDDGTFKSQIRTITSVEVSNNIHYNYSSGNFRGAFVITPTYAGRSYKYMTCSSRYTIPPITNGYILSENKTFQTDSSGNITSNLTTGTRFCCLVDYTCTDGVVTKWEPHFIDAVANSNMSNISSAGRSFISGMGMPSTKYENWTLGASGSTYTAPANGYMLLRRVSTSAGQYVVGMDTTKNNYYDICWASATGQNLCAIVPCLKGAIIQFEYAAPTAVQFRFIYAEGEN